MRLLSFTFLVFLASSSVFASAPEGIPRELARERAAEISGLRYRLSFVLTPQAPATSATEEIRFRLRTVRSLLLDFRDGTIHTISLNGALIPVKIENGHIELPIPGLRLGDNTVRVQFADQVAPAGKAITRYEDRDDHAEYIYTLFVPMDASMAFPCFDQPDLKGRFKLDVTAPEDWTIISNASVVNATATDSGQRRTRFAETRPISTYLFAFAAGPFRKLPASPGTPELYVRKSKFDRAQTEAPEVQQVAASG